MFLATDRLTWPVKAVVLPVPTELDAPAVFSLTAVDLNRIPATQAFVEAVRLPAAVALNWNVQALPEKCSVQKRSAVAAVAVWLPTPIPATLARRPRHNR